MYSLRVGLIIIFLQLVMSCNMSDNPLIAPVDARVAIERSKRTAIRAKAEFGEPHDDNQSDEEDTIDGETAIVPVGNIDDAESTRRRRTNQCKGKRRIQMESGKGVAPTTEIRPCSS